MSTNLVIAVVKSVLHTQMSNREVCDSLARKIAEFIAADNEFSTVYGSDIEGVEEFTRDYLESASGIYFN